MRISDWSSDVCSSDLEGISSTGWATFLQAVVEAGYAVVGTWPLRTEMANRMIASGTNALANSVVLVCRKKEATAEVITRAEFIARKSVVSGQRVSVRVGLGGRRVIKKKI